MRREHFSSIHNFKVRMTKGIRQNAPTVLERNVKSFFLKKWIPNLKILPLPQLVIETPCLLRLIYALSFF